MASNKGLTYGHQNAVMVMAGLLLGIEHGSEHDAAKHMEGGELHPMQGAAVERAACLVHEDVRNQPELMSLANKNAECLINVFGLVDTSPTAEPSQICIRSKAGVNLTLTAVPMSRRPSDVPEDWLRFQGQQVSGLELSERQASMLQLFMRFHRTEAVTDGSHTYTVVGAGLAHCSPQAFQ